MRHGQLTILTPLVLLFGCSGHNAPDIAQQQQDALTAAVPQKEWIQLKVASLDPSAQSQSQAQSAQQTPLPPVCQPLGPSDMAIMTHTIASDADNLLGGVLGLVAQITSSPPSSAGPGQATWAPLGDPASPVFYRLDVAQVAPNAFHFQFSGGPKAAGGSVLLGLLQGTTVVADPDHRAGDVEIDFGAMHALDPSTNPVTGGVAIHFDNTTGPRIVDAQFSGVAGPGAPQPNDAHYHLEQAPDSSAVFEFFTRTDFDRDGTLDELLHVESRWASNGAGAAHVNVSGGSLGPRQVNAIECWAPPIIEVFYADDVNMNPPRGDQSCCPQ
jgi:hypothetical protein